MAVRLRLYAHLPDVGRIYVIVKRRSLHKGLEQRFDRRNARGPGGRVRLPNLSALILEDAFLIAYEAEQALFELGATSVTIIQTIVEAFEALEARQFDLAVLDLSVGDDTSIEFAQQLDMLGVPFVFTSGYARPKEVQERFPDVPYLEKPYSFERLKQVARDLLAK
jgi:CheY-like chemotaxis protein